MGIQINGNTNNINAGIGSLSIEDIHELDLTGIATASNFKTGVSNLHNVGLTLSGGQIDVGSNIKIGTAGVITATSFVGSGANLTGLPAGTTISGNANNRIITGSGTANTLNAESTFTYDGDGLLSMTSTSGSAEFTIVGPNNTDSGIYFNDGANDGAISYDHSTRQLKFRAGGHTRMYFAGGNDSNNNVIYLSNASYDDGIIQYWNGGLYLKTGNSSGDRIISFNTAGSERLRIDSTGRISAGKHGVGTYNDASEWFKVQSNDTAANISIVGSNDTHSSLNLGDEDDFNIQKIRSDHTNNSLQFFTDNTEKLRITSGGQLVQYTNHTSGTSAHQSTGWYGDDANHYTLEYKDFNEIRAVKILDSDTYSSIVYKREMMTEYCDIEFTLKGNAPSGTNRHTMFVINGDGSDTFSNYDRLVFRYRPGDTSGNQIRLDKGGGGSGFSEVSSSVPNFFDGNERHVHIQIRKRTFSITVNRMGQSEYNYNVRTNADLVSSRGYFGFSLYERASHGSPELTIRDFKITNYTQNAIPSTSVAFQATHSGNPGKSSGYQVKPCNVEIFDNGYGGNYNTSNYRFTAPVAGIYQFGNTFNCYSNPSSMFCAIRVNGSTMYTGGKRNSSTGSGDQNVVAHCIVQLQPGDYVEALDNTGNGVTYSSGATWNRFEGSLIAAFK